MISRLLFIIYMAVALYFLLMSERLGRAACHEYRYNLRLFSEIKRFYRLMNTRHRWKAVMNLWGNIICFMPYGFYLSVEWKKKRMRILKVTVLTLLFSLCVELLQLYHRIGIFDVDDLVLNTVGGFLGAVLYELVKKSGILQKYFFTEKKKD